MRIGIDENPDFQENYQKPIEIVQKIATEVVK